MVGTKSSIYNIQTDGVRLHIWQKYQYDSQWCFCHHKLTSVRVIQGILKSKLEKEPRNKKVKFGPICKYM